MRLRPLSMHLISKRYSSVVRILGTPSVLEWCEVFVDEQAKGWAWVQIHGWVQTAACGGEPWWWCECSESLAASWRADEPHCLGKASDPGQTGRDPRLFVEAVLCIVRTCAQWRDVPDEFGKWNSVFKRFRKWVKVDTFYRIFTALAAGTDFE